MKGSYRRSRPTPPWPTRPRRANASSPPATARTGRSRHPWLRSRPGRRPTADTGQRGRTFWPRRPRDDCDGLGGRERVDALARPFEPAEDVAEAGGGPRASSQRGSTRDIGLLLLVVSGPSAPPLEVRSRPSPRDAAHGRRPSAPAVPRTCLGPLERRTRLSAALPRAHEQGGGHPPPARRPATRGRLGPAVRVHRAYARPSAVTRAWQASSRRRARCSGLLSVRRRSGFWHSGAGTGARRTAPDRRSRGGAELQRCAGSALALLGGGRDLRPPAQARGGPGRRRGAAGGRGVATARCGHPATIRRAAAADSAALG